jgi:hypothetical protein
MSLVEKMYKHWRKKEYFHLKRVPRRKNIKWKIQIQNIRKKKGF